jgi:hypothetical protein
LKAGSILKQGMWLKITKKERRLRLNKLMLFSSLLKFLKEPIHFNEAWSCIGKVHQRKWRESINKELNEMKHKGEWEVIEFNDISDDRRCIKCKWLAKRNGIFRARLVEYNKVTGTELNESFTPVINNLSFRILWIAKLVWNMKAATIDIETPRKLYERPAWLRGYQKSTQNNLRSNSEC